MSVQRHNGHRGGGIVRRAVATEMCAGGWRITSPLAPGAMLDVTDDGDLAVMYSEDERNRTVELSLTGAVKMSRLTSECIEHMEPSCE